MITYAAHVTTDLELLTDEQLDEMAEKLAPQAGVPSLLGGRLSVQLTVEAENLTGAAFLAAHWVVEALDEPDHEHIVGVEVLTQAEFARRLDVAPEAAGSAEVASQS